MANIGYLQVVRHCNHFCGFCSNPASAYVHTLETMQALVDDLVGRGYFGVVLTGGEPTLHPDLPAIARYARERGLHVRMITNGWLLDDAMAHALADAGVSLVHVSIYSVREEIESAIRGVPGSVQRALGAIESAHRAGIEVNVNCVINRMNADHLDENAKVIVARHPHVRHFVWNNLDPSMGRAEVNQDRFVPRLADLELSLHRALSFLHKSGRTFRVERVPLCYMTEHAWASTETRKIVKGEERVVHFLDGKQTVRQTEWDHAYGEGCEVCTLRPICGGLFDRGGAYDPGELAPSFVPIEPVVEKILVDAGDPSWAIRTIEEWRPFFEARRSASATAASDVTPEDLRDPSAPSVGLVTEESLKRFAAKRRAEQKLAERTGHVLEPIHEQLPTVPGRLPPLRTPPG